MELIDVPEALWLKGLELEAQGYPEHQARSALRWAFRRADGIALKALPQHREGTFAATLEETLEACGRWLDGNRRAGREGDMARGVARAASEGEIERGYQRLGVVLVADGAPRAAWLRDSQRPYEEFWSA